MPDTTVTGSSSTSAQEEAALPRRMRGVRRSLFLAELLICFGPCSVMAMASLLTLIPSVTLLLEKLFGTIEPVNDVPWRYAFQPILLSLGAFAGLFALHTVAQALLSGQPRLTYRPKVTILMALAGVAAIVVVGIQVVPHQPKHAFAVLCVYAPLLATAHISLISRRLLFPQSLEELQQRTEKQG